MIVVDLLRSAGRSSSRRRTPAAEQEASPLVVRICTRLVLAVLLTTFAATAAAGAVAASDPVAQAHAAPTSAAVCGPAAPGYARCLSLVRTDIAAVPSSRVAPLAAPSGYGPSALQAAYNLAGASLNNGAGQTLAVVDAYDQPNAESDLAAYRTQFGLPPCTTANGCFRKVNQSGGTSYPRANSGWGLEIALDLQMVSAICPNCHILLVEASSASFANLGTAVNRAVTMGAVAVSNSYGGGDSPSDSSLDSAYYNHPGVAITASSGDGGYGVEYPAASQYVVAVGGTTLTQGGGGARGWTESAWSGAGSGCSAYEAKPAWQTDAGCTTGRTVADVSAVADPNTGVAVYDTYGYGGWLVVGGTSASSPIIASTYALAGTPAPGSYPASYLYAASSANLYDVTSGSNGSCGGSYVCTGVTGYDGPTGLGTPNGIGAFAAPRPSVTSISPTLGPPAGGTTVTLTGVNFSGATSVAFGTKAAPSLTVVSGTSVRAVSPSGTGTVDITVTTPNGTSATGSADRFTYSVAPAITSANSTTFTVGSPGTFSVTTTGAPAPAISESGALPAGVTLTDNSDGTATLAGTPAAGTAGSYPITITAANGVAPDASQGLILTVAGPTSFTLSGSVTAAGTGVVDAWVYAFDAGTSAYVTSTASVTGGAYSLVVPPGSYKIYVQPRNGTNPDQWYGGATPTVVPVSADTPGVDIALAGPTSFTLSGSVTAAGTGVVDAWVYAFDAGTSAYVTSTASVTGGAYSLVVPPGSYKIYVQPRNGTNPDQWYGGATPTVVPVSADTPGVDIALAGPTSFTLSGSVTAAGTGVVDAWVYAFDAGTSAYVTSTASVTGGAYSLVVPPGSYKIYVQPRNGTNPDQWYGGATPTVVPVSADTPGVDIALGGS